MASVLSGLKSQIMTMLPKLIETAEPQLEIELRKSLQQIKITNPNEAQLFLTNWKKLNNVVQSELVSSQAGGKKKRTKTLKRYKKRT